MFTIVLPIFLVILTGYLFASKRVFSKEASQLINDYVLYVALPALLFLSVAQAEPKELLHWEFVVATLLGILVAYVLGVIISKYRSIQAPKSSIVGMAACYGTTGYMGVPISIAAFGQQAAVPAAIATILHNIPAIMAVIITFGIFNSDSRDKTATSSVVAQAAKTTLMNPLTLSVIAGVIFSVLAIPLPETLITFTTFLAAAAGPTALFALGVGLASLDVKSHVSAKNLIKLSPIVGLKILIQPMVTFLAAYYWLKMDLSDIYLLVAIVMAAQPVGAGVYVFANKYDYFQEETSISIIISLLITVLTLSLLLDSLIQYT